MGYIAVSNSKASSVTLLTSGWLIAREKYCNFEKKNVLKARFCPPRKPKIKNYFTTFSKDCFIE